MILHEFLDQLEKKFEAEKPEVVIGPDSTIRIKKGNGYTTLCPIEYLADGYGGFTCGRELGMPWSTVDKIIHAADNSLEDLSEPGRTWPADSAKIRRRFLEIFQIEEVK